MDIDLNIYLVGDSIEDLVEQLKEELSMLYQEYVLEQDCSLTLDAVELKRKLLNMLVVDENTCVKMTSEYALQKLIDEVYLLLPASIRQELFQAIRKDLDELKILKGEEIDRSKATNYNHAEKYIKKPITIEAFHYRRYYTDYRDLERFCGEALVGLDGNLNPILETLEGEVSLCDDCYVIKGVKGEFYPCQADIFYQSYSKCRD